MCIRDSLERTLAPAEASAALGQLGGQYVIALVGATVIACALGWALAGRELAAAGRAFAAQERFVANASHELRSPLTVIRTDAEVALADPDAGAAELRAMGERAVATVEEMDELLDGLMLLAQSRRPLARPEPLDLAAAAPSAPARAASGSSWGRRACTASAASWSGWPPT